MDSSQKTFPRLNIIRICLNPIKILPVNRSDIDPNHNTGKHNGLVFD